MRGSEREVRRRGGRRGGGRGEGDWGKGGKEKEEKNCVSEARAAQRGEEGDKGWKGENPTSAVHHLVHPSREKHKCLIFWVVADFNPRRKYIGVSENWVTVTVSSIQQTMTIEYSP